MTINHLAQVAPHAPAITIDGRGTLDREQLDQLSARLANALRARGLGLGNRVALLMDNSLAFAISAWAARRSGLRAVPINWQLKPSEVAYVIEDSDARALIASTRFAELVGEMETSTSGLVKLADPEPFADFTALNGAIAEQEPIEPSGLPDGAPMYYSSGTTGKPKGICRDTGLAFGEQRPIEHLYARLYELRPGSVVLIPAPLYFAAPFGWMMAATALGCHVVLLASFDAERVLTAIEEYKVTHALLVPTHFVRLLRVPAETRARFDLSSLRTVVHAGAPCPPEIKAAMIAWWGTIIHEYYSGSEGAGFTTISSSEWLKRPGSVGRAVLGAIHILDEDGAELPPGEVGTIWFEDAPRFEYHKAPNKTAAFFNSQGWGTLGDLGHLDEHGFLYIANRRSDLILSGGANVYPQEIENAMASHPAVRDVAAVGVADQEYGQVVRLLVVVNDGFSATTELRAELLAWCRARLAGFKCPRSLLFVPNLPRLESGKLLRRDISGHLLEPDIGSSIG